MPSCDLEHDSARQRMRGFGHGRFSVFNLSFLNAFFGRRASVRTWPGRNRGDGRGLIEVEEDGSIRAIPLQNRDEIKAFLYDGTRLDTPAGGRTGNREITVGDDGPTMSLTLQIRFARGWKTAGGRRRDGPPTRSKIKRRRFFRPEADSSAWSGRRRRFWRCSSR